MGAAAEQAGKALEDNAAADLTQVVDNAVKALAAAGLQISEHKKLVIKVTFEFSVEDKAPVPKNTL